MPQRAPTSVDWLAVVLPDLTRLDMGPKRIHMLNLSIMKQSMTQLVHDGYALYRYHVMPEGLRFVETQEPKLVVRLQDVVE